MEVVCIAWFLRQMHRVFVSYKVQEDVKLDASVFLFNYTFCNKQVEHTFHSLQLENIFSLAVRIFVDWLLWIIEMIRLLVWRGLE